MKCSVCGAEIKEGALYCDVCGAAVQIVPDYSPLDEVLTAHVRGEIEGRVNRPQPNETGKKSGSHNGNTSGKHKHKKRKKNKKKKMLIILGILLAVIVIGLIVFRSSYAGLVQRGNNAIEDKRYNAAYKYFQEASEKSPEKPEAYAGMAKVLTIQDQLNEAENIFITQLAQQQKNAKIYRAAAEFYVETKQTEKIPIMLDNCEEESVLSEMSDYLVEVPMFSLEDGTYEEVQTLELSSNEGYTVYYTLDETEPSVENGTKYGTEIKLDEKEWVVKAICVNDKGIPSLTETKKINVELPIADPPIVSPSSGLYEENMEITIQVPDGFTAYYVFGSTEPTKDNWTAYDGPISMPEGNKIFSAVLMEDSTGKISAATVRNYDLKIGA